MPFYSTETIENVQLRTGNPGEYKPLAGEFMKAGVVTYRRGTGLETPLARERGAIHLRHRGQAIHAPGR